jgi:hypothetical protein
MEYVGSAFFAAPPKIRPLSTNTGESSMQQFAMYEVHSLLGRLPSPVDDRDPIVRYVCALFAELAYYHIPAYEIDDKERAKVIPCEAYQALVAHGTPTNVSIFLQQSDFPRGFVVVDRGAIAVGVVLNRLLFIGFRGTQFLFDWRINLRSRPMPVNSRLRVRGPFVINTICGRLHSGFSEEALRISAKVLDAIRDSNLGDIDYVFLTGHSLGGAVAAISENFLRVAQTSVCIFGAPRYSDVSAYYTLPEGPPTQVRRPGDVVPTVPPKWLGYMDHPYEFTTDGQPYVEFAKSSFASELWRWARFLGKRFEPHYMEAYRHELGHTAGASGASANLVPFEKLSAADIVTA